MGLLALSTQVAETAPLCCGARVLDKYRIEEVLGEGGMAVVYRAIHEGLGSPVAIKVIRRELAAVESAAARMMLEARAAASLQSHHVARVFDVGQLESGLVFIVMEFLEGRDLYEVIRREGPLPEAVAVDYVLQACEALAEAHARGIVHRDLKPENLFLTTGNDGVDLIKVLDFGVSKQTLPNSASMRLTSPSHVVGSLHYMAPEQMRGAEVGVRADIYSIGVILFELVTGGPPFDAESIPAVCARVLKEAAPRLSGIRPDSSAKLAAVIERCLRKSPEERFDDVAELAAALADLGSPAARRSAERVSRVLARRASADSDSKTPVGRIPARPAEVELLRPPRLRAKTAGRALTSVVIAGALSAAFGSRLLAGSSATEEGRMSAGLVAFADRIRRAASALEHPREQPRDSARAMDRLAEQASLEAPSPGTAATSLRREARRHSPPPNPRTPEAASTATADARNALDPWSPESFGDRH